MDIRDLRLLSLAAQGKSLSQAAEVLGVSQPTATKLVRTLEETVGGDLFYRGKRPIQLTPLGLSIAEQAMPLVEGIDRLVPQGSKAELEQPVIVASTHDIFAHVLADVLGRFHGAYPQARVVVREGGFSACQELVAKGQAHFMVGAKPPGRLRLEYKPLGVVRRVVLTPPDHPLKRVKRLTLGQLSQWPIILAGTPEHNPTTHALLSGFRRQGLQGQIAFEVSSMDSMKRFVARGFGIGAGPAYIVEPGDRERLAVIPAASLLPNREMGLVTLPGKPLPPQAALLMEMVETQVPAWLEHVQAEATG